MLNTAKLIGFAATTDPAAARKFYEDVLDLTLVEDSPFALVFDANGTMLRIQKVETQIAPRHTVLGWSVEDIQATVAHLSAKGVHFDQFDGLPQDASGIWTTPDRSRIAWFKDPDGNTLSLTEFRR